MTYESATYESASGDIVVALAGEAMITRALQPFREPEFLALRDLLHGADVRFANGEMLFHDYEDSPTYNSQTWMRCDPRFIGDLQWLGINLLSCANNHGLDYGEGGVLTNIRNLDGAGLAHAGSGKNMAAASAPVYLDTAKGRVALVSGTTSARANARAGEQRRDLNGRPGVNLLRWVHEWTVDEEAFGALARVAERFGWSQRAPAWWDRAFGFQDTDPSQVVYFPDRNVHGVGSEDIAARFTKGPSFATHTRLHQADLDRNLNSVREARRMADWVIYSIHNHEGGETSADPSEHVELLARAVIDAGADIVVGHGPHRDRGIEIYNGRPIVYSLGNFIMQNDTVERLPADTMALWNLDPNSPAADMFDTRSSGRSRDAGGGPGAQSAVVTVAFAGKELSELQITPIEFGYGLPRSQSGRPLVAGPEVAQVVLERFGEMSQRFGTTVEIKDAVGIVS